MNQIHKTQRINAVKMEQRLSASGSISYRVTYEDGRYIDYDEEYFMRLVDCNGHDGCALCLEVTE